MAISFQIDPAPKHAILSNKLDEMLISDVFGKMRIYCGDRFCIRDGFNDTLNLL